MADPYSNVPKTPIDQPTTTSNPNPFIQIPPTLPNPPTSTLPDDSSSSSSPRGSTLGSSRRHPVYRGIRCRSGKWVSEIREPRKTTRIWLGTYPKPEMAAAAYDVAAIALKGPDTPLNFPNSILTYPIPASSAASDIRSAAARAAQSRADMLAPQERESGGRSEPSGVDNEGGGGGVVSQQQEEYMDEEELLNMPNLLVDMAEGMLVSPPRISSDNSPGNSDGENLWSY
ncbi:ethylene-responsive transcription factor ERF027-like [Pyrus x bretschneideri]|uniref:ethylene-responsive transcription factor ERF027-like n=1 Tax=Pyrus x bretschneideri TaxID=225117 RepID=UPI00202DF586|nr:ethylene-responsive transcription factor ERF027-like [Pyrus x bretschneideri]